MSYAPAITPLCREVRRLLTGAALPVDGDSGHGIGQARGEQRVYG